MKKNNKYFYVYVIQGYYSNCYGWEDVTEEESLIEARKRLKEYRENDYGTSYRRIRRRELNPLYQPV